MATENTKTIKLPLRAIYYKLILGFFLRDQRVAATLLGRYLETTDLHDKHVKESKKIVDDINAFMTATVTLKDDGITKTERRRLEKTKRTAAENVARIFTPNKRFFIAVVGVLETLTIRSEWRMFNNGAT